jgi:hypothetical protein
MQSHWAAESAEAAQTQLRDVRAALAARERRSKQQERELQAAIAQSTELSERVVSLESELAQRSSAAASPYNSCNNGYYDSPRNSASVHGVDSDGFLLLDAWHSDDAHSHQHDASYHAHADGAVKSSSAAVAQRNSSSANNSSNSYTAAPVLLQQAVAGSPMLRHCDSPSRRAANNSTSSDWSNWQQQQEQQQQQQHSTSSSSMQVPMKHMSSHFSEGAKSALTAASGSEWAAPADARKSADWLRRTSSTAAATDSSSAVERQQQQQRGHSSSSSSSVQYSGDSAVQTLGTAVSSNSSRDAQRYGGASTADLEHELMLVNMEKQQVCACKLVYSQAALGKLIGGSSA